MEKIEYFLVFSKFCHRSEHNPVQNIFATICLVTVSFIKIGSFKDILFEGGEGGTSRCGAAHFAIYVLVFWSNGTTQTCCGWNNQMNALCSDLFVWIYIATETRAGLRIA